MFCPNCKAENDQDAEYCQKCGSNLKTGKIRPIPPRRGISNNIILLIVVILIAGLGLTSGLLFLNQSSPTKTANVTMTTTNTTSTTPTSSEPNWHEIITYSGVGKSQYTFTTRGNTFKIVMTATPILNYKTNYLNVQVLKEGNIIDSGSLNWGPYDDIVSKESTIQVNSPPGIYTIKIDAKDLEGWTITIYDYY